MVESGIRFIIGFVLLFLCFFIGHAFIIISVIDYENVCDNARVIEIKDNTIIVEAGEKYGDKIIYELEKPFYKKIKIGDIISVKTKNGIHKYVMNREKMRDIGIRLIILSMAFVCLIVLWTIISSIICYFKRKKL